jgi:ectoine hydroxylase-related dioxygenase (phytanoyl-CoA dioxygenase family)
METAVLALPDLSSAYRLESDQIQSFRCDGHICLRGLCTKSEVEAYSPVIETAFTRKNKERRRLEERDTYGKAFLQTLNLRWADERIALFVYARRFAQVAAQLMGVRAVRVFHEQALFKEPGGGPTPWHQDQYYWPLDTPNTIGLWMPLVDVNAENGALVHASGSHTGGSLGELNISDRSQSVFDTFIRDRGLKTVSSSMRAGDATFHYGWTLHSAPANHSNVMRKAMIVTYFADGARIIEPRNPSQENDRIQYLGGLTPGSLANGPMNPIVYEE